MKTLFDSASCTEKMVNITLEVNERTKCIMLVYLTFSNICLQPVWYYVCLIFIPRESEGLCFYRRWFVCLSVCLFVCYHDN